MSFTEKIKTYAVKGRYQYLYNYQFLHLNVFLAKCNAFLYIDASSINASLVELNNQLNCWWTEILTNY